MAKLFAATTQERMLKCLVYEYEKLLRERLPACSAASGKVVETSCTILDLNNVGLSNFYRVKGYVGEASTIGQNYCESRRDQRARAKIEVKGKEDSRRDGS